MKAFVAYRFTGASIAELEPFLKQVVATFNARSIDTYCSLFDEPQFQKEGFTAQQIFEHTFSVLDASHLLFVIQTSNEKSEGMLMEIGYCIAKRIPIVVAQHERVTNTYVHELSQKSFRFTSTDDLCQKIAALEIPSRTHAS